MRLHHVFLFSSLLVSSVGWSNDVQPATTYAQLAQLFQLSGAPVTEEMRPLLSGRCYWSNDPAHAVAGLIAYRRWPEGVGVKMIPLLSDFDEPGFFDRLNSGQREVLEKILKDHEVDMTPVRKLETSWNFKNAKNLVSYEIRRSPEGLLLIKAKTLLCYYFREPGTH
ncbi:hypothetical protein WDW37_08290 [Bdellovibrionota bacterium FG-1]